MVKLRKQQWQQSLSAIFLSTSLVVALLTHAAILDRAALIELNLSDEGYTPPSFVLRLGHSSDFSPAPPSDRPDINLSDPSPVPLHQQGVPIDQ
jgi:hypothetical protein